MIDHICAQHLHTLHHSHQVSNILIELDGDRAGSEAYVTASLRVRSGEGIQQITVWGRYVDRWSRRERPLGPRPARSRSSISTRSAPSCRWPTTTSARRDRSDPVLRRTRIEERTDHEGSLSVEEPDRSGRDARPGAREGPGARAHALVRAVRFRRPLPPLRREGGRDVEAVRRAIRPRRSHQAVRPRTRIRRRDPRLRAG